MRRTSFIGSSSFNTCRGGRGASEEDALVSCVGVREECSAVVCCCCCSHDNCLAVDSADSGCTENAWPPNISSDVVSSSRAIVLHRRLSRHAEEDDMLLLLCLLELCIE